MWDLIIRNTMVNGQFLDEMLNYKSLLVRYRITYKTKVSFFSLIITYFYQIFTVFVKRNSYTFTFFVHFVVHYSSIELCSKKHSRKWKYWSNLFNHLEEAICFTHVRSTGWYCYEVTSDVIGHMVHQVQSF